MKKNTNLIIVIFIFNLSYISHAYAQIETGRPLVVLLTPESIYAGSLDEEMPAYQTDSLEGLFSNEEIGLFDNWFALEITFQGIFHNGMNVRPEDQMLILAIPPENNRDAWLKIVSILFDRFNIPELYIHETQTWDTAITPELTPGEKLYWISRD